MRFRRVLPVLAAALLWAGQAAAAGPAEILVLYDNTSTRQDLTADWGFAALVTFRGQKVLFDSGTKPDILLANMKALGVDPASIQHVVISHEHGDHINGVYRIYPLNRKMQVAFLDAFHPKSYEDARRADLSPVRIEGRAQIVPGIETTGAVPGDPSEQALVIHTAKGLVVLTGCSHPGVVAMVEAARRLDERAPVRYLLGGFHMLRQDRETALGQVQRLRALGVRQVAPTHCTGNLATGLFREVFGDRFETAGAGRRIVLE
jgi:7,8-dihydropterin-6-yl-methyl-4-(beta-D-ribofuranosyl)aminobenzene 5'-phosphate synthase